jgi:hypothetical protein
MEPPARKLGPEMCVAPRFGCYHLNPDHFFVFFASLRLARQRPSLLRERGCLPPPSSRTYGPLPARRSPISDLLSQLRPPLRRRPRSATEAAGSSRHRESRRTRSRWRAPAHSSAGLQRQVVDLRRIGCGNRADERKQRRDGEAGDDAVEGDNRRPRVGVADDIAAAGLVADEDTGAVQAWPVGRDERDRPAPLLSAPSAPSSRSIPRSISGR